MDPFYGINLSATRIDFQGFMVSSDGVQSMGLDSKELHDDFLHRLVPGEILRQELTSFDGLRQHLTSTANGHSWIKWWKKYLGSATQAPIGVGIGVPYAMAPLVREALRIAVADATRNAVWVDSAVSLVVTVEVPLAVAIEKHASGDYGEFGIISQGFGRVEATLITITRDQISIRDFREWSPGDKLAVWNDWELSNPTMRWLKLANQSEDFGAEPSSANIALEAISPEDVTCGVARYAWSRRPAKGVQRLPTIQRIVPRALGIVARNSGGELFWHRLVNAGEAWPVEPVILRGEFDKQVVIHVACCVDDSCDKEWLPQSQWLGRLHWWQELLPPTHSGTPAPSPIGQLSLICANPEEGLRFGNAVIDRNEEAGSQDLA